MDKMIPKHLYVENFRCFDKSNIDFDKFDSALLIGVRDNNTEKSNGSGKTSIFLAIEYCLFNEYKLNMERMIRDGCKTTKVQFDFIIDNIIYRIVRSRSKSGTTDVSFYSTDNLNIDLTSNDVKSWKDLCGRRSSDTEKEIKKTIKITYETFRGIVHFAQRDMSGLSTASPTDRKKLLKSALDLSAYSELEKLAKDNFSKFQKDIDVKNAIIANIGDPDLNEISDLILSLSKDKDNIIEVISDLQKSILPFEQDKSKSILELSNIESNTNAFIAKKSSILKDISQNESIQEKLKSKLKTLSNDGKVLVGEISKSKNDLNLHKSNKVDVNDIKSTISKLKDLEVSLSSNIKTNEIKIKQLQSPLPKDNVCQNCKQEITDEYRESHQQETNLEISKLKELILVFQKELSEHKSSIKEKEEVISEQNKLDNLILSLSKDLSYKEKEVSEKRKQFSETKDEIANREVIISGKKEDLNNVEIEISKIDLDYINSLKSKITIIQQSINSININIKSEQQKLSIIEQSSAVSKHKLESINKDIKTKLSMLEEIKNIEKESLIYPEVINAFSSAGIPNLIIQSVLDSLQNDVNEFLNLFIPGLQSLFVVEKESKDKTVDTLDIIYYLDEKERVFGELSGAQQISASFALKLGLSAMLQKLMGFEINFLLIDEIDESLDSFSIDMFSDIIKVLEKKYKILVITHNEKMKTKFNDLIIIDQDINRVSKIRQ
jgi:exonuclease SbcC